MKHTGFKGQGTWSCLFVFHSKISHNRSKIAQHNHSLLMTPTKDVKATKMAVLSW